MTRYYSQQTGSTYLSDRHAAMPADAVPITESRYLEVIANPAPGKIRSHDEHGLPILIDPPMPTPEQIAGQVEREYEQAVQAHLDTAAKIRGYDDIVTAISYADEPAVPKFQADGGAFRAWRSLVWDYCYVQLAAVKAGTRTQPTKAEFVAELPALDLP